MACNYKEFFLLYFGELERRGIPYVILHSYQEFPEKITSDIDYSVPHEHLSKLHLIQAELAQKNDWALVQTLQHGVFAYYSVLVNLANPTENLRLDACSSYARARRYFVAEETLLANRVAFRGFYIPAPPAEFAYVVAKMFDAKNRPPAKYLPRLKELWLLDKTTAEKNFTDLFGNTGKGLEQWFNCPPDDWRPLGPIMYARKKFGPALLLRESARVLKRTFHQTGFGLAFIGLDAAAKIPLVARLEELLQPCFRYQPLHFRPGAFGHASTGAANDTYDNAARSGLLNCFKVAAYYINYLTAWWFVLLPAKIRSHLIIVENSFDELLVEEQRFGLRGMAGFVRWLRWFLPRPDRTFVIVAPTSLLQKRQPGQPMEALEQQQKILRQLAEDTRRYTTITSGEPLEELARTVWREVVNGMAAREARRA